MRFSLRLRWFGTAQAIAGCLVVIGVSSAAGRAALHRVATVAAERRVGAVARALSSRLARLPARRRLDLVRRAGRAKGLVVALTDPRGRVTRGTERPPVSDARLQDWLVQESGRDGRSVYRAVTLPSPLQDTALVVATRIGQPSDAVSRLDRALAVVAAFVLLLGILAAHAVWDDVAGGVVDLTARVRSMTAGTAAGVVPIGSLDEAGDLSRAVNRLAAHHAVEEARGEEARRRLDEADREKSEFLATVSHELRTPLNSIIGFSQLLLGGMDGDLSQAQREDVHIVESSGNHLLGIINDILDLSAMESRRIDLSRVIVHLDALAREVVRAAEGQLRGKSIVLRVDMRPPPDPVDADPKRLRQILGNLVANAIKFTQKGEIVVRARAVGRFVEVEVADTGPGIPSSELETIFESYAQLGDAKVRRRGTGLGLAICRHLVELHGGEIRAESQLGRGSSFFFTVPRAG